MNHSPDLYTPENKDTSSSYKGGVPDLIPELADAMRRHLHQQDLIRQSRDRFAEPGHTSVAESDIPRDELF